MTRTKTLLGLCTALTAGILASTVGAAYADYAPSADDAVGVGSDTVQYLGDFLADGSAGGDTGYNSAGNKNKVVSFDATPDANGRAAFAFGGTGTTNLNPTIVLRAGVNPWQRPNGSSAGINALLADTAHNIDFVRSSRLPSSSEYSSAASSAVGAIRAVKISTDNLKAAVATTTNAPSTISAASLANIFDCTWTNWNQLPGSSTSGTIEPVVPQIGSGTRSSFLADMAAAKSGFTLGTTCGIIQGEEHDPSVITGNPNRIAPFSEGRLNLFTAGYFKSPTQVYGTSPRTSVVAGIKLVNGAGSYLNSRGLYIVVRQADAAGGSPFQPGGTASKVQDLFYSTAAGAVPFAMSDGGQAAIAAAGATPTYTVCGVAATTC